MKKLLFLLIFTLLHINMFCDSLEFSRNNYNETQDSNSNSILIIKLENKTDQPIKNIKLTKDNFEGVTLNINPQAILLLKPGEITLVELSIANSIDSLFKREKIIIPIYVNVENKIQDRTNLTLSIVPPEQFWIIFAASLSLILIVIFVTIFIKLSKSN